MFKLPYSVDKDHIAMTPDNNLLYFNNENGTINSLSIRQTCDLRGKTNRLRKMKIDVALFN